MILHFTFKIISHFELFFLESVKLTILSLQFLISLLSSLHFSKYSCVYFIMSKVLGYATPFVSMVCDRNSGVPLIDFFSIAQVPFFSYCSQDSFSLSFAFRSLSIMYLVIYLGEFIYFGVFSAS